MTEPNEGTKLYFFVNRSQYQLFKIQDFLCNSLCAIEPQLINEYASCEAVEVINQDNRVEIKKGEKVVDFQGSLSNYFNKDKNQTTINTINYSKLEEHSEKSRGLTVVRLPFEMYTNVSPF